MEATPTRFLPRWLAAELRHLPWRLVALTLLGSAAFVSLALATWTYSDPSLDNATNVRSRNVAGPHGAAIADALLHSFGLASVLLILPISALGLRILTGIPPLRVRLRVFFWIWASIILPVFFSSLPAPRQWPFNQGLGGITGDFLLSFAKGFLTQIPSSTAGSMIALIFGLAGAWTLARACDTRLGEFVSAVKGSSAAPAGFIPPTWEEESKSKMTRWAKRLSPRAQALVAVKKGPQEFWMTTPPSSKSTEVTRTAGKKETSPPVKSSVSPFADWGIAPIAGASATPAEYLSTPRPSDDDDTTEYVARMEPFFGPSPHPDSGPEPADDQKGGSIAPFRRLTSKVTKVLNGKATAKRSVESAAFFADGQSRDRVDPFHTTHLQEGLERQPYINRDDTESGAVSSIQNGVHFNPTRSAIKRGNIGFEPNDGMPDFTSLLPPLNLLSAPEKALPAMSPGHPALMRQAAMLMDVLTDFGVKGRITGVHPGPVITLFELEPARGTKSSRVVGLADDIARSMSAVAARIAVVPGRDAIGIELPNAARERVNLRTLLEAPAFTGAEAALPLALGKSISGAPIVADLARMPHLLIAGTTGSGKSVGINTMILSLLYRLPASQCNFIMIDPKMLELSAYDGIPHLLTPVVTDPKKAVLALKWTVKEMNARYERMSKLGVRNITSYNARAAGAALRGEPLRRTIQAGFDDRTGVLLEEEETFDARPMPYIVVVIDEMADLMMVAGKEIEFAVQRLSQMARAAGIHLIMATQRPSVDVVTGTIKANFPSRISFQVTSKIDSRTIIGEQGAEQLLGAGDMLYMASGGRIVRAHGPFVSDGEVEAITRYLRARGTPAYRDDILEDDTADDDEPSSASAKIQGGSSDLYEEAIQIVLKDRKPTTSYLQRRLGIGYNRAASLIERMEHDGLIGAPNRTGRREILTEAPPQM